MQQCKEGVRGRTRQTSLLQAQRHLFPALPSRCFLEAAAGRALAVNGSRCLPFPRFVCLFPPAHLLSGSKPVLQPSVLVRMSTHFYVVQASACADVAHKTLAGWSTESAPTRLPLRSTQNEVLSSLLPASSPKPTEVFTPHAVIAPRQARACSDFHSQVPCSTKIHAPPSTNLTERPTLLDAHMLEVFLGLSRVLVCQSVAGIVLAGEGSSRRLLFQNVVDLPTFTARQDTFHSRSPNIVPELLAAAARLPRW